MLLRGHTVFGKLPKIPLFENSLNHHLRILGCQQSVKLNPFNFIFNLETTNSLAEINLESTGEI
jgi:hypothetical protein